MNNFENQITYDGAPCAMKVACTVRMGGKAGDHIKSLPIHIFPFP